MPCLLEDKIRRIERSLEEIRRTLDEIRAACKECDEAQREYERTLMEEGAKAAQAEREEAEYWKRKYYEVR